MSKLDTSGFTGTEAYHRASLFPILLTDGAKYVAEEAGAFWLMDEIGAFLAQNKGLDFLVTKLTVANDRGTIMFEDGNYKLLGGKEIEYTDFPEPGIELWAAPGYKEGWFVVMVPTEY